MAKIQVSPRFFLVSVLCLCGAACSSDDDRTQVLIDLQLGAGVPTPETVGVSAWQGGNEVKTFQIPWGAASSPNQVGLFFPGSIKGQVTIAAKAYAGNLLVAQGQIVEAVTLNKGKTVGPFALALNAPSNPTGEDGGITDGGEVGDSGPDAGVADAAPDGATEDALGAPDVLGGGDDAKDAPSGLVDAPALDGSDAAVIPDATDDGPHALAWQPAANVQNDNKSCSGQVVAVDPSNEHVYTAWVDNTTVKVRRWNRQTASWEATVTLQNRGTPDTPGIGVDVNGKVTVLWPQNTSGVNTSLDGVWMSQSTDGSTWSAAVRIAAGASYALKLAMAKNGTGHAAYAKKSTSEEGFWALHTAYFDGTAWTEAAKPVEPKTYTASDFEPQLAVGSLGDGLLIYYRGWDLTGTALTGVSFTDPIILNPSHESASAYTPALAVNRKNEGVVVWTEYTGGSTVLLARGHSPAGGWGTPTPPLVTEDSIGTPAVALDEQGTITLAWQQYLASGGYNLVGKRGKIEGPWSEVTALENDNRAGTSGTPNNEASPTLAVDAFDNIMVVWRKDLSEGKTATIGAYARRYAAGAWSPEATLGLKTGLVVPYLDLAVAESGLAAVGFKYIDLSSTTTDPDSYQATVAIFR